MDMHTMEDWEKWAELAKQDPEKFEEERAAILERHIMGMPADSRHRCRQMQWKIDAIRKTSPNSLASCIRIYDLLMDSVYGPRGLLKALTGDYETAEAGGQKRASRLEFHASHGKN